MRRLRLFHFDIRTTGNYGDSLLFEAVRNVFQGVAGGEAFDVYDSASLRDVPSPRTIDYVNQTADGVIVGGGGLFLGDTNANARSGWQWNISLDLLRRLEKPLIVFAVGNNRFIGQPDFAAPFTEHLALTMEKSIFFGLRNHGSVNTIRTYLPEAVRDRVVYQPCPTVLSDRLYPDLARDLSDERVIGVQQLVGRRQARAGFRPEEVRRQSLEVLQRLKSDGWEIHGVPFARADDEFDRRLDAAGLRDRRTSLYGGTDVLFRGVELFPSLPIFFGTRGHAQMVPFGMGSLPVSAMVHDKLRYFAEDIGRPGWVVDPREDDYPDTLYRVINEAYDNRQDERADLRGRRDGLFDITHRHVAEIYRRVSGEDLPDLPFTPYTERERRTVEKVFNARLRVDHLSSEVQKERRAAAAARAAAPAAGAGTRRIVRRVARALPAWSHPPLRRIRRRLQRTGR